MKLGNVTKIEDVVAVLEEALKAAQQNCAPSQKENEKYAWIPVRLIGVSKTNYTCDTFLARITAEAKAKVKLGSALFLGTPYGLRVGTRANVGPEGLQLHSGVFVLGASEDTVEELLESQSAALKAEHDELVERNRNIEHITELQRLVSMAKRVDSLRDELLKRDAEISKCMSDFLGCFNNASPELKRLVVQSAAKHS